MDISVKLMWDRYATENGIETKEESEIESWHFCSDKESADHLAELVVKGIKRGTASLKRLYELDGDPIPKVGDIIVITDFAGIAKCMIQIKKIHLLPFCEISEELAFIEGEGDKSLAYWKRVHQEYFEEELKAANLEFSEEDITIFEEFEVIYQNETNG